MKINTKTLKICYRIFAAMVLFTAWYAPIVMGALYIITGVNYMSAVDVAFEYMGKEPLNVEEAKNVEMSSVLYWDKDHNFWAFIADSKEEYYDTYEEYGLSDDMCEIINFDDYILVMSINRPLAAIRIMSNEPVWKDSVPYSYPQFVFERTTEKNMVYYYKVYRIDTKYQRYGQVIVSRLKLWRDSYFDQNSGKEPRPKPRIEKIGPFKRWDWALQIF